MSLPLPQRMTEPAKVRGRITDVFTFIAKDAAPVEIADTLPR